MQTTLNAFAALGRPTTSGVRAYIQSLLSQSSSPLHSDPSLLERCTVKQIEAMMHLPFDIGDFTDFTSSKTVSVECVDDIFIFGKDNLMYVWDIACKKYALGTWTWGC
jgi:hypothetical protein